MQEEIFEALKEYGLEEKEIKVYLACFNKEPISAQRVAEKSELIRQVTYDKLRSLIEKGLVNIQIHGKAKRYQVSNPEHLITSLEDKKEHIKSIMPKLEELNSEIQAVKTTSYYGLKGLKTLLYSTLNSTTPLSWITNYQKAKDLLQEHIFFNYTTKRVEKKIQLNAINNTNIMPANQLKIWKTDKKSYRKAKYSKKVEDIPSTIIVFENKVIMINMSQLTPHGVLIEDEIIAKSQKALFDILWNQAKEY